MTFDELKARMRKIAAPVVQAYHGDLDYDFASLERLAYTNCSLLWAPRPCGTHLISLDRDGRPNAYVPVYFDALEEGGRALDWYFLDGYVSGDWRLRRCKQGQALKTLAGVQDRAKRHSDPGQWLHM